MALSKDRAIKIARAQRLLHIVMPIALLLFLAALSLHSEAGLWRRLDTVQQSWLFYVMRNVLPGSFPIGTWVGNVLMIAGVLCFLLRSILLLTAVVGLCRAREMPSTLYIIGQFILPYTPLVNLFLSYRTTRFLRQNGLAAGWLGTSDAALAGYHADEKCCEKCGEFVKSEVQTCPVCGALV